MRWGGDGDSWCCLDGGAWENGFHEVLSRVRKCWLPRVVLSLTARRVCSKRGCCDTMLIKQLLEEAEGVSSNWLLCRFPVKTVSPKSKCHQSSAAEQPLRNLQVGRMHWFITAVILPVLGFICGGGGVRRKPLLCFLDTNAGSGGWYLKKVSSALKADAVSAPTTVSRNPAGIAQLRAAPAPLCKPLLLRKAAISIASSLLAVPYLQGLGEDGGFAERFEGGVG